MAKISPPHQNLPTLTEVIKSAAPVQTEASIAYLSARTQDQLIDALMDRVQDALIFMLSDERPHALRQALREELASMIAAEIKRNQP